MYISIGVLAHISDHSYWISSEMANWDDARAACLDHAGDLIALNTREEADGLGDKLDEDEGLILA